MTSDPWRYRCLECGSTQLKRNTTYDKGDRLVRGGRPAETRYTCGECGAKRNERKDMKTGKVIA